MPGIQETKDLIAFGKELVKVVVEAKEDGKINFLDLPRLLALIPIATPAFVGMQEVPNEIKDLDLTEVNELVEYVKQDLNVGSEKAKVVIGASFKLGLAAFELYLALKPVEDTPAA